MGLLATMTATCFASPDFLTIATGSQTVGTVQIVLLGIEFVNTQATLVVVVSLNYHLNFFSLC